MDETSDKPAADVSSSKGFSPARLSPLLRRALTLLALLVGCAVAYGVILAQFDLSKGPRRGELGALARDARVKLYLQPIQIDAVNESMQVHISVVPLANATVVMMFCALIIGTLVFVGVRRIEVTLVGALGAMIFALPAVRNALPGAPPLDVRADILIFFWAELGAIIALCLFITAWARQGARP